MIAMGTSSLPALVFAGSVLLVYYFWVRLWFSWLVRKALKKDTSRILNNRCAYCLHIAAFAGLACFLYAYFVEPYWVETSFHEIRTTKLQNARFRIVQISDMHCDDKVRLEAKLPEIIKSLNPDVIVFTGDTLASSLGLNLFHTTMKQMQARLGTFAVDGNWDCNLWQDLKLFNNTGFKELDSQKIAIEKDGEFINIAGVSFEDGDYNHSVIGRLQPESFNLLLYHTTDLLDYISTEPVDLYLCGHTHGGQVALPFYGALTTLSRHGKRYEAGMYHRGSMLIYVNRGIGMEGGLVPPVRFLARPEIAVFDIMPADSSGKKNE